MAGDWIKMTTCLARKPEVIGLSVRLKLDEFSIVGRLHALWSWADEQSLDGVNLNVTESFIDRLTNCPGFSVALRKVGGLQGRDGALTLPNFDRHNGQTAKTRALAKDRMATIRSNVAQQSEQNRTREDKSQEKKKQPSAAGGKQREPDVIWDAVCAQWNLTAATKRDATRIGAEVRDLKLKGATPDELATRIERYKAHWPDIDCTPEAMVKHWDMFTEAIIDLTDPLRPHRHLTDTEIASAVAAMNPKE